MAFHSSSIRGLQYGRNNSTQTAHRDTVTEPYIVENDDDGMNLPVLFGVAFCILMLLVLLCCFGWRCKVFRRRLTDRRTMSAATSNTVEESPEKRYQNIESWLITKLIYPHDDICDMAATRIARGRINSKELRRRTSSVETLSVDEEWGTCEEDDGKECPICFDALDVGSFVSWSTNPKCEHVFHHRCIKEWLLRQTHCPCCREKFLPIDHKRGNETMREIKQLIVAHQYRTSPCFYCVSHGIVRVPNCRPRCDNEHESELILYERARSTPDQKLLVDLRGADTEIGCTSKDDHEISTQATDEPVSQTNVESVREPDEPAEGRENRPLSALAPPQP